MGEREREREREREEEKIEKLGEERVLEKYGRADE